MTDSVTRNSYSSAADATTPPLRVNRQGNLVIVDQYDQWIDEGRVFCSSDADGDDIVPAISGFVATTPQLLIDVPLGTTIKPMWANADQQGTAEDGATGNFIIMYDDVDRFGSAGNSETITNMRASSSLTSSVTVYTSPTANAANAARVLYAQQYETSDGTTTTLGHLAPLRWTARENFSPLLVGPAAFIVWMDDKASTPEFSWSLGWAEFPTAEIT